MSQPSIGASDRIRELSAINAEVPALLISASGAINALTARSARAPANGTSNGDIEMDGSPASPQSPVDAHKQEFTKNTTAYFTHLQAIMARLRRQVYALEEAGVIAAEAPTLSTTSTTEQTPRAMPLGGAGVRRAGPGMSVAQRQAVEPEAERVTNGGLGNLDVGYLNSRGNRVGLEKEAELIAEAKMMLRQAQGDIDHASAANEEKDEGIELEQN